MANEKLSSLNNNLTIAKTTLDKDKKEVTLTVNKDLKWSNGKDVTADDIIATYKLNG